MFQRKTVIDVSGICRYFVGLLLTLRTWTGTSLGNKTNDAIRGSILATCVRGTVFQQLSVSYQTSMSSCSVIHLAPASSGRPTLGLCLGDCTVLLHRTRLLLELRLLESFSGGTIDGVVCVMSSCGMSILVALARAVSAGEGTHRGSVWCRSAASPQVLFLLEGSLTYHCACSLRLAESCIFFFFCFPSAVRGYLLSPLIFSVFTRCVWALVALASELFPPPQAACGRNVVVLSPCACSPVRSTGAATLRAPVKWLGLVSEGVWSTSARGRWSRAS